MSQERVAAGRTEFMVEQPIINPMGHHQRDQYHPTRVRVNSPLTILDAIRPRLGGQQLIQNSSAHHSDLTF